jgi:hypothetical protein
MAELQKTPLHRHQHQRWLQRLTPKLGLGTSGGSMSEVKPLLPALFRIISIVVTMLLELFGLEEEEKDRVSLV